MKKVTIVITTYNRANLVTEAVESVIAQTYGDIEIIVVDDGSTDNTEGALGKYLSQGTIKYVKKKNEGACVARNIGIKMAGGEFVGVLDSDDLYMPEKVARTVKYFGKYPDTGFVYSSAYIVSEDKKIIRKHNKYQSYMPEKTAHELLFGNFICNSSVIVRKQCFDDVGYYDENIFLPADWDLWIRLAEKFTAGYVEEPLIMYRKYGGTVLKDLEKARGEDLYVLDKTFKRNPEIREPDRKRMISRVFFNNAVNYLFLDQDEAARNNMELSLSGDPLNIKAVSLLALKKMFIRQNKMLYHIVQFVNKIENVILVSFLRIIKRRCEW
ncbi:MAG: glycosyltransferase [Candidatus Omnitrophica bacterium]|nr:glycosyltransferase [Candidatus Omnitrophota bacterium]